MPEDFLADRDPIPWQAPEGLPKYMKPVGMFPQLAHDVGATGGRQVQVSHGLEVVLAQASRRPTAADMRVAWRKRKGGRASPVLMLVFHFDLEGEKVSVCGPVGEQPAVHQSLEIAPVERIADCALSEPNYHAAVRFLAAALPEVDSPFPGLRNVGLLSTQELRYGVPKRKEWRGSVKKAAPMCALRGQRLVEALGYKVEMLRVNAWMLTSREPQPALQSAAAPPAAHPDAADTPTDAPDPKRRAVAVFCRDDEPFEAPAKRFDNASPVSKALAVADLEEVDWVILTRSSEIRLYAARRDTGVGRKGRAESYVEVNLALLPREHSGYLPLLFSAAALSEDGTFEDILKDSHDFAAKLAKRLRERVYQQTVPALAQAVADRMPPHPSREDLADAYEQVMVILFRLLFVAYAEDKDLLPYRTNGDYADRSLSKMARRLSEDRKEERQRSNGDPTVESRGPAASADSRDRSAVGHNPAAEGSKTTAASHAPAAPSHDSTDLWDNVVELWSAVNNGRTDWGVPTYNGGLFSSDRSVSPAGAAIAKMRLTDAEFAPALSALLTEEGREGPGPIDFRELSARDFGTIYEGLLESSLSLAEDDMTLKEIKKKSTYVPAKPGDPVVVKAGKVYLHDRSGARKETGSFFTKSFAVEHLLDHALEPALDEHLKRLDELREIGDHAALSEAFFDFRCADIAMGSGHFLVAALDRIEAKLSAWLTLNPIGAIIQELRRLRENAFEALGDLGTGVEIESSSLLRRQVARHCIYGVDKNRVAVELARLAVWVHTFVPGLPLSFLDHNLVCGDSLTGVGSLDEIVEVLDRDTGPKAISLFRGQIEEMLHRADEALKRLAHTSDANKKEIDEARIAHRNALDAVSGAWAVCDVITAHRAGACGLPEKLDESVFVGLRCSPKVEEAINKFQPLHFPVVFPEVFLRDRPGFDCLLGNPPWEQVVVNEKVWWGLYLPGIRGLPVHEMNAAIRKFREERPDLEALFQQSCSKADHMRGLLRSTFRHLGSGYTDLYKAFCWRNWQLMGNETITGIVLPRAVLQTKGSSEWRKIVLEKGSFLSVLTLLNTKKWVFDDVHAQKLFVLMAFAKMKSSRGIVSFRGPYPNQNAFHLGANLGQRDVHSFEFESWSDDASFPQVPDHPGAMKLFRKLRQHPRFDSDPTRPDPTRPDPTRPDPTRPDPTRPDPTRPDPSLPHLEIPTSARRLQRDDRQASIHPGFWRFHPVREFDATADKHRFVLDSGSSVRSQNFTPQQTNFDSSLTVENHQ